MLLLLLLLKYEYHCCYIVIRVEIFGNKQTEKINTGTRETLKSNQNKTNQNSLNFEPT